MTYRIVLIYGGHERLHLPQVSILGPSAILQGLSEILQHFFDVSLLPLWQLLIPWFWIYRLMPEPMFNENFSNTMLFKLSKPVAPSLLLLRQPYLFLAQAIIILMAILLRRRIMSTSMTIRAKS